MPIFTYDAATSIHYDCYGSGEHAAILVHGFGDTRETWERILPFLETTCRLFLLDLRGSGLSSKPRDGQYAANDHVEIITAFVRDRGLTHVSLVGHSFGGGIVLKLAQELAVRTDLTLERVVLIDAAGLPQHIPTFVRIPALPLLGPLIIYGVPARLQSFFSVRPLYKVPGAYGASRSVRYARSLRSPGGAWALMTTAKTIIADRYLPWLSDIANIVCPTLIIWGNEDPAIPVAHAYELERKIGHAELLVVPSCGHVPHEEVPEIVGPLISKFLSIRG
jgi:pimeloyl-ACP methyl ester carboxylesterase